MWLNADRKRQRKEMRYYPAIVEKEADSDFGVFFPDFPGCVSAGPTMSEAVANAEDALALHIKGMIEDDEALPEPSEIESVVIDPEVRRVALVLVPARLPGNVKRVNITLDENLLADIDATAASRGLTRSGFLAEAARRRIEETKRR
jgi:predicted RNase H-like HicB family nuclease